MQSKRQLWVGAQQAGHCPDVVKVRMRLPDGRQGPAPSGNAFLQQRRIPRRINDYTLRGDSVGYNIRIGLHRPKRQRFYLQRRCHSCACLQTPQSGAHILAKL